MAWKFIIRPNLSIYNIFSFSSGLEECAWFVLPNFGGIDDGIEPYSTFKFYMNEKMIDLFWIG